jgi:drug/metabolite transporter (DMT)-like permease
MNDEEQILAALDRELPPGPPAPAGLVGELKPVPPGLSTGAVLTLFAALLCGITVGGGALLGARGLEAMTVAQVMILSALGTTLSVLLGLAMIQGLRPGSKVWLHVGWANVLPLLGFLAVAALAFPWRWMPETFGHGWGCLKEGIYVALASSVGVIWLVRRGYVTNWSGTAGTLGAFCGLVGAALLHVMCPDQEATHLIVWHGGILASGTLGGLLAGYILLRRH